MIVRDLNTSISWKDFSLLNDDIFEIALLCIFACMPFSTFINAIIFNDASVFGMSAFNVILLILMVLNVLEKVMQRNVVKYPSLLSACFVIVFLALIKILLQGGIGSIFAWLQQYEYYLFVPMMLFILLNMKLPINRFLNAIIVTSIPVLIISIYSFYTSDYFNLVSSQTMEQYAIVGTPFSRMMGTFGSPNVAGSYYAIVLGVMVFANVPAATSCRRKINVIKVGHALCLLACLVLSFSRMALIGFVFAMILLFIELSKDSGRTRVSGVLSALALFLGASVFIAWMADSGVYFWASSDFVNNPRLEKWFSFLESYDQWFFFGAPFGFHIISGATTLSDNSFLLLIGSIGFVPALLYFVLLAMPIISICKVERYLKPYMLMLLIFMLFSDFVSLYPSAYCAIPLICLFASMESKHENFNYNTVLSFSSTQKRWSSHSL